MDVSSENKNVHVKVIRIFLVSLNFGIKRYIVSWIYINTTDNSMDRLKSMLGKYAAII